MIDIGDLVYGQAYNYTDPLGIGEGEQWIGLASRQVTTEGGKTISTSIEDSSECIVGPADGWLYCPKDKLYD